MTFPSISFLFYFLPVALVVYHLAPRRARNAVLVVESLVFYVWGAGGFVLVLLGSTAVAYAAGRFVERSLARDDDRGARRWVVLAVVLNLGALAFYKYAGWFTDGLNELGDRFGVGQLTWDTPALPLGISFFTFQALSYVIDVRRGRARPSHDPVSFTLYMTLFPHILAGPIIRHRALEAQLRDRDSGLDAFAAGAVRFAHGLVKKLVIADAIAVVVNAAYSLPAEEVSLGVAWLAAAAFLLQLYFDFSSYSDMAIGLGQMFGFVLPENFRRPFSAMSITEFWQRWHITLSSWFRDYVFQPLRGSGRGRVRTSAALIATFALVGVWHGANWTFVVFGTIHGSVMVIERLTGHDERRDAGPVGAIASRLLTLAVLVLTVPFFRADSVGEALRHIGAMLSPGELGLPLQVDFVLTNRPLAALVVALTVLFLPRTLVVGRWLSERPGWGAGSARFGLLAVGLPYATALMSYPAASPFIYFRF